MASTITGQISEDSDLITALHALSAKSPKLVKSSIYSITPTSDPSSIKVRSWKMNEFKYYDVPSPFPTLARGLFSMEILPNGDDDDDREEEGKKKRGVVDIKRYQIVVRGYDKFFNIGEVPWTTWSSLEACTTAPYTLSLKSNGCIIFIAALTPTKLLVTSKHSLGPVPGAEVSHSQAGEAWLRKYLVNKGKTEADLAERLWESNLTAIAELCDDSFEEHVLGYPPEKTGLHLHGLNIRSKQFKTLPTKDVDAFADDWGFIQTPTIVLNSIQEVRDFTNTCGETGEWNGEAVEGFVVRTYATGHHPSNTSPDLVTAFPYKPGSCFFFKVKFDEPYMMYRDWREVTKMLLATKGQLKPSALPKSKMKRTETQLYVKWVIEEIKNDRSSFDGYAKGKGIIATRERFLKFLKVNGEGTLKALNELEKTKEVVTDGPGKAIIVPVAIPGCGKTSISVALAHIFGFGHTQSDDVLAKSSVPAFIKNVTNLLHKHDVVIADKNNHLKTHRLSLRNISSKFPHPIRLLALNWSLDQPRATIHRICGDRIQQRGENHQSLRGDASTKSHEEVVWMFLNTTEELTPNEVDNVIEMEIGESMEDAVKRAVEGCVQVLGLEMPCEEKIQEALGMVKRYAPSVKKPDKPKEKNKKKGKERDNMLYYGLLPEVDLVELMDNRILGTDEPQEAKDFWMDLKADKRVTKRPHVTIVHRTSIDIEHELWDRCTALHEISTTSPPLFKGKLGHLVWNGRVMAITVEDFDVDVSSSGGDDEGQEGHEFVSTLPFKVRERLHITVGTKNGKIPSVEAKTMVEEWRNNNQRVNGIIKSIKLDDDDNLMVYGRIKGLMH